MKTSIPKMLVGQTPRSRDYVDDDDDDDDADDDLNDYDDCDDYDVNDGDDDSRSGARRRERTGSNRLASLGLEGRASRLEPSP